MIWSRERGAGRLLLRFGHRIEPDVCWQSGLDCPHARLRTNFDFSLAICRRGHGHHRFHQQYRRCVLDSGTG
jgi:hypothetical protein